MWPNSKPNARRESHRAAFFRSTSSPSCAVLTRQNNPDASRQTLIRKACGRAAEQFLGEDSEQGKYEPCNSEGRKIVCSRCCQRESIYQRRSIGTQHISETMMALAVLWDLDAHVDQEVYLASEYEG